MVQIAKAWGKNKEVRHDSTRKVARMQILEEILHHQKDLEFSAQSNRENMKDFFFLTDIRCKGRRSETAKICLFDTIRKYSFISVKSIIVHLGPYHVINMLSPSRRHIWYQQKQQSDFLRVSNIFFSVMYLVNCIIEQIFFSPL